MASPFPGMDPYLEQPGLWPGFHGQALSAIVAQLVPQVTPAYVVQMEEQLFIHELPAEEGRYLGRADIAVGTGPWPGPSSRTTSGMLAAPVEVRFPAADVEQQRYIEIRDRRNRSLVTVIELLSPSNKRSGPDREQYLTKRGEILAGPAHLVEIDLPFKPAESLGVSAPVVRRVSPKGLQPVPLSRPSGIIERVMIFVNDS